MRSHQAGSRERPVKAGSGPWREFYERRLPDQAVTQRRWLQTMSGYRGFPSKLGRVITPLKRYAPQRSNC